MTRRKGEIRTSQIKRDYPFHVALKPESVRGLANSEAIWSFIKPLSAAPRTWRKPDSDLVIYSFAKEEDAKAFSERFGGELLTL